MENELSQRDLSQSSILSLLRTRKSKNKSIISKESRSVQPTSRNSYLQTRNNQSSSGKQDNVLLSGEQAIDKTCNIISKCNLLFEDHERQLNLHDDFYKHKK